MQSNRLSRRLRRRSTHRQNGRQHFWRPKNDLLVAGFLRVSREKTSPISAGNRLERRREYFQARGSFFGSRDSGEGIPRRDRLGRRSVFLNRPRASANRNPASCLLPRETMPRCNTPNVDRLWLHYVSHRLVTRFSRGTEDSSCKFSLQIDVLPIGGSTAQQVAITMIRHPSSAS